MKNFKTTDHKKLAHKALEKVMNAKSQSDYHGAMHEFHTHMAKHHWKSNNMLTQLHRDDGIYHHERASEASEFGF